ncbi:M56 family metallopeptidase [Flavobacterium gelidilacus]|uniref:M56 family metallopeptidase n=1 Tax=Flavobacterium gelidilacus TaxID=206041 RepID=UPI00047BF642|nr:M56 family metallopeptidase [Flavobacterium gelidilacus]
MKLKAKKMNDFLVYSLQTILLQLGFLIIFEIFFKKETFFKANRFYLLGSILLSLIIPLIKIPIKGNIQKQTFFQLKEIVVSNAGFIENKSEITSSFIPLFILYGIGILVFLMLFLIKLFKIYQIKKNTLIEVIDQVEVHRIKNSKQAFSFFNYIFIGNDNSNIETIVKHEKVHKNQLHSLDLVFLEMLKIIFWFNPLVYFYQKRIVETHEFEADSNSISENKSCYYETLICQIFEVNSISLTNNFYNQSLIKKRLVMLQKSKSKKAGMIKYLVVVPMTVLSLMLFSTSVVAQVNKGETVEKKKEKLLKEIKEFNQSATKEEKIKVLDENFLEENLKELSKNTEAKIINTKPTSDDPIPFALLENPPAFEGCEEKTGNDAKECFIRAMNDHIKTHFNYPKEAVDKKVQGRVTIMFQITKEGLIENLNVKGTGNDNSYLLEEEAIKIIRLLPKFQPAMIEGEAVAVSYAQPIAFRLQK